MNADFNIFAFPRSFNDLFNNPQVFRGLGQSFRAEIVPGTDLERYLISIGDPLLFELKLQRQPERVLTLIDNSLILTNNAPEEKSEWDER